MLNSIHVLLAFAAGNFTMYEPVFGTKYDTSIVKFETFPQKKRALCELPRKLPWWIYAQATSGNFDYYILSGLREIKPDGKIKRPWPIEPDYGTVARISNSKCELTFIGTGMSDAEKMTSDSSVFPLSRSVSSMLARDFVRRCLNAIGKSDSSLSFLGSDSVLEANGVGHHIFIDEIRKLRIK